VALRLPTVLGITGKRASITRHENSMMCRKKINILPNIIHCIKRREDLSVICRITDFFLPYQTH
jgi:hypothetical protein